MSRSSSSVTSSRCRSGSPPMIRTARSVDNDRSHTIGLVILLSSASGRAITMPHRSAFCMATRFGASSPNTRVTYDKSRVTRMIDTGPAAPPRKLSGSSSGSASDTAAAADGEEAGERDADLDRGEESVRLASESGEHGTRCGPGLEPLQLTFAQRHERELGTGEGGVHDDEQDHQADLGQVLRHRRAPRLDGVVVVRLSNHGKRLSGRGKGTTGHWDDGYGNNAIRTASVGVRRTGAAQAARCRQSRRTVGPRQAGGISRSCTGSSQCAKRPGSTRRSTRRAERGNRRRATGVAGGPWGRTWSRPSSRRRVPERSSQPSSTRRSAPRRDRPTCIRWSAAVRRRRDPGAFGVDDREDGASRLVLRWRAEGQSRMSLEIRR